MNVKDWAESQRNGFVHVYQKKGKKTKDKEWTLRMITNLDQG